MSSPQHCLAMAEEADRLAGIVSYERDKDRLRAQAATWRQMAGTMAATIAANTDSSLSAAPDRMRVSAMVGWLKRRRA